MKHNIALFDLLRAVASIAVVLCHCAILGGGILFNNVGGRAVDVFMFTSGFLMVFTAVKSREYDGVATLAGVRTFWLRRFFRISPLYYVMLVVAVLAGPFLGACREQIGAVLSSAATPSDRYIFASPVSTLLWHLSYAFGLFPSKAYSTPLPDWSLSLEMQFYAVFPIVFILLRRHLVLFLTLCVATIGAGWYIQHTHDFPMPSFLPLKFHVFAAGMLTGAGLLSGNPRESRLLYFLGLLVVTAGERHPLLSLFVLACQTALLLPTLPFGAAGQMLSRAITTICRLPVTKFFADISYSLYLIHLLIALPFFGYVFAHPNIPSPIGSPLIWLGYSAIILAISTSLAYLTYRFIELPGMALGKKISARRPRDAGATTTGLLEPAAPTPETSSGS